MAKLRSYVHVTDDNGYSHEFGPGDDVPAWAQAKIVNPDAWASAPAPVEVKVAEPKVVETTPAPKPVTRRARKPKTEATDA